MERGDVFHVDLNPIQGREQAGARHVAIVSPKAFNVLGTPLVCQGRLVAVKLNAPGLARPVGIVHRRRKKFNRATERLPAMLMASPARRRYRR